MSGKNKKNFGTLAKLFQVMRIRTNVNKTIGQFTKVRTPRRFKKTKQLNYEHSPQQI